MKITREQVVEWSNNAQAAGFRVFPASQDVIRRPRGKVRRTCLGYECDMLINSTDPSNRLCPVCRTLTYNLHDDTYSIEIIRG